MTELALEALRIAHRGLSRRGIEDAVGRDETQYLTPLFQIAEADFTPAEDLLCAYHRRGGMRRPSVPRVRVLRGPPIPPPRPTYEAQPAGRTTVT